MRRKGVVATIATMSVVLNTVVLMEAAAMQMRSAWIETILIHVMAVVQVTRQCVGVGVVRRAIPA
jgi:hypothetical protein